MSERQTIYEQDCEFYRYQDGLMWSRLKTAVVVEAALLYAVYDLAVKVALERAILVTATAMLVGLVFWIAFRDAAIGSVHLARIRRFERDEPFGSTKGLKGLRLMQIAMLIVLTIDVGLVFKVWLS